MSLRRLTLSINCGRRGAESGKSEVLPDPTDIVLPNVLPTPCGRRFGDFTRSARIGGCLAHLKNLQLCTANPRQELAWEIDRTKSSWETKLQAVDFPLMSRTVFWKAFSYLLRGQCEKA